MFHDIVTPMTARIPAFHLPTRWIGSRLSALGLRVEITTWTTSGYASLNSHILSQINQCK